MIGRLIMPLLRVRRLPAERSGTSTIEFAVVAPVFLAMLMAVFDLGFLVYAKAVLQGAVEDGARSASLENTTWADIEERVNSQVTSVIPVENAETDISFDFDPTYYGNYSDIALPEDFTDTNGNGVWDVEECYVDRNNNRTYDTDVGLAGRGGAQDVVSISASVTYRRIFPLWSLIGQTPDYTIAARTYLRNQPFSAQAARVGVRVCPEP
jgi:hypothetical protein